MINANEVEVYTHIYEMNYKWYQIFLLYIYGVEYLFLSYMKNENEKLRVWCW